MNDKILMKEIARLEATIARKSAEIVEHTEHLEFLKFQLTGKAEIQKK